MGGVLNRLRWGGNPDIVDPDTGLSKRDIYNVKRSWEIMYADEEYYGMQIFLRLFRLNPVTQTYFNSIKNNSEEEIKTSFPFKAHVISVMSAINMVVENLHQPPVIKVLLSKMGNTHSAAKVDVKHFGEIKLVLVGILKNDMGVSHDMLASWARFITFMFNHILDKLYENIN